MLLLSLVVSLVEILKHYIIIFDQPLIGKAEIAVIPDYDVIQHLELHDLSRKKQFFCDLSITRGRLRVARGMIMDKNQG